MIGPSATAQGEPNCVFCRMVTRQAKAVVVYEDEHTLAIMDRRQPAWPLGAHLLVMPRQHVEAVDQLSADQAARLMQSVVRIARAVRNACMPDGISVWQSNGEAAGQEVPHVHVHVLARSTGDALLRVYPDQPATPDLDDLQPLAESIRAAVDPQT